MIHQKQITFHTTGHGHMHDLTSEVARAVAESGSTVGIVHIFNVGSTGAIGAIEYEPGLEQDLPAMLNKLMPESRDYAHEQTWHDGNGHSHLQATTLGPSLTVPISSGELALGTWQQVFHLECDNKGHQRTVVLTIIGE